MSLWWILILMFSSTFFLHATTHLKIISSSWKKLLCVIFLLQGVSFLLLNTYLVPRIVGVQLIIVSGFYLNIQMQKSLIFKEESRHKASIIENLIPNKYVFIFPFVGLAIMAADLIAVVWYFNGYLGRIDLVVLLASIVWALYIYVPNNYSFERDFIFIFINLLALFLVSSTVVYEYLLHNLIDSQDTSNKKSVVHFLLTKPLSNLLNLMGYYSYARDDVLFYQDLTTGHTARVWVATSCSGIYSVYIFVSAFTGFVLTEYRRLDSQSCLLLLIGIIMAYFANLLRMFIIVLSGHYWGEDTLYWTHRNVGWLIFTFWVALFWKIAFQSFKTPHNVEDESS